MDCRTEGRLRAPLESGSRRVDRCLAAVPGYAGTNELLKLDGKKRPSLLSVCCVEAEAQCGEAHLIAGRFHKPEEFRRRDQCDHLPKFPPDGV